MYLNLDLETLDFYCSEEIDFRSQVYEIFPGKVDVFELFKKSNDIIDLLDYLIKKKLVRELSKKELTILAIEYLIKYYGSFTKKNIDEYSIGDCPLCFIHSYRESCKGCPSANKEGHRGCTKQPTFKVIWDLLDLKREGDYPKEELLEAIKERKKFWERNIGKIKRLPKKQFTIEGWKYLDLK